MPLMHSMHRDLLLPGGTVYDKRVTDIGAIRTSLVKIDRDLKNALTKSMRANFPGDVNVVNGSVRNYVDQDINIHTFVAWVSESTAIDLIANVLVNGAVAQSITIPAGETKVIALPDSQLLLSPSDYLTVDIVAGVGKNLTIRMDYIPAEPILLS